MSRCDRWYGRRAVCAREAQIPVPTVPNIFGKYSNAVVGPGAQAAVPATATQIDYEAELGVIIGRRSRNLSPETALNYVAGYVCVNGLSSRALQFEAPQKLRITCQVNGETRQDSSTAEMVFSVAEIPASVSRVITLEPADVIATGTPAGVGMGFDPPRYFEDDDEVAVEIDGRGRLVTVVQFSAGGTE